MLFGSYDIVRLYSRGDKSMLLLLNGDGSIAVGLNLLNESKISVHQPLIFFKIIFQLYLYFH